MISNLYMWEKFFKFANWKFEYNKKEPSDDITCDILIEGVNTDLALYVGDYPKISNDMENSGTREDLNNRERLWKIVSRYSKPRNIVVPYLVDFDNIPDKWVDIPIPYDVLNIPKPLAEPGLQMNNELNAIQNPIQDVATTMFNLEVATGRTARMRTAGVDMLQCGPIGLAELSTRNKNYINFDTGHLFLVEFQHQIFDVCVWSISEYRMIKECVLTSKKLSDADFVRIHTVNSATILFNLGYEYLNAEPNSINDNLIL